MESTMEEADVEDEKAAATDLSYPPVFLQPSGAGLLPASPCTSAAVIDVPVLDLHRLDPVGLRGACRDWGLFRLVHHGIPPPLSAALQAQARDLLSLPFDAKRARFCFPGLAYFWGTPALTLHVKDLNWLEGLHIPLGRLSSSSSAAEFDGLETFWSLVDEYKQHLARIARTLFEAMAADLKLDAGLSASYLNEHDGTFRIYRYPKCARADDYFAMEAHTDSSVLSIVNQDDVGGLQVLRGGGWSCVEPIADTLIVNLGDIMQAISDDQYKSVEHRVRVNRSKERISLCYFGFPMEDGVISSSRYREFTYREFKEQVQEDIKLSGAKVGLRRFRVNDES
ncbi:2OG-Fe(II) oxygenase superfamily [Musa troglodytarum]|uniref:2OG-Fe(II) oxygenase superfamily n=2 Tax=Musa troglodytarum TaxID=320322 RepID=A0A9E7I8N3_9LILI|nr:2OG-Fe(II) oxygenase superfamily [Musa troglodytarum]URE48371.1 2OG-Fe(II) oxygenase superfamily [Musa troglodytarum]